MPKHIFNSEVLDILKRMQGATIGRQTKTVTIDGQQRTIPVPFPSPGDWRDGLMYFLMIDRFNHPSVPPKAQWNVDFGGRQGGSFKGVQARLEYLKNLGVNTIWLSPVLKTAKPERLFNYPGYGIQDFLTIEGRLASDGTLATAENELTELVDEAHARGMYVILDIVLNHTAQVFDYVVNGQVTESFTNESIIEGPLGVEPPIRWLNGFGVPRSDWENDLPTDGNLSEDDAVWPSEFQHKEFFRRRGNKFTDAIQKNQTFVRGDFGSMRQLVVEYDATVFGQETIREQSGDRPVLNCLIHAYQYLIAKFDIDGFRIDTVKYVDPQAVQIFGNAIREYALSIGKTNFFTFGEIWDGEETVAKFVGRNGSNTEGFGIDAALDFPLFSQLPAIAKGMAPVEALRTVFEARKQAEKELLSSHGEAGRFFVTFLDNHDQHQRFNHPASNQNQITLGLALLFCLQGIPCVYYGTEQGLLGTDTLNSYESVREALWGKPSPFDQHHPMFLAIQSLANIRASEPALRYGRLYFRQVSANRRDFGFSDGSGGIVAFSRILADREVIVIANTSADHPFIGMVLVDRNLARNHPQMRIGYSNLYTSSTQTIQEIPQGRFFEAGMETGTGLTAALPVDLQPMEVQIWRSL